MVQYLDSYDALIVQAFKYGRIVISSTAKDGRCQYDAVSHGLKELRKCADFTLQRVMIDLKTYLGEHREFYSPFFDGDDWDKYLHSLTAQNLLSYPWGSHMTLQVYATMYNISIRVIRPHGAPEIISPNGKSTEYSSGEIVIAYNDINNYFATRKASVEATASKQWV